jgi:chaperone modulatory protein CbpM
MSAEQDDPFLGTVLDEHIRVSLRELCGMCGVSTELIVEMVSEGIVEPEGGNPRHWQFTGVSIQRIQTAIRLQRDLKVNLAGAALALDLLEELAELRRLRARLTQT